jgi:hypothetical protein
VQLLRAMASSMFPRRTAFLEAGSRPALRSSDAAAANAFEAARSRTLLWLLIAAVPFYLLLALIVPPWDDELYYWCWSQELQFSYYDHPPMVAYLIRLSTAIFGHSILAIRIPCICSALVVLGVVTWLSRPRDLIPFIFLSPVATFAAVMITPDVPLLMFWSLYMAWLVCMHRRLQHAEATPLRLWHWVLGGFILGCGVLGKYTTGLVVVAGFLTFASAGNWRRWLGGYTVHGLVSMATACPILIYNIQHDFVPIKFQWEHTMSSEEPGLFPFFEFVGSQLLLVGSAPFFTFVWGLRNWRSLREDPRLRVCACLFLFPFGFFLYKATRGHLEGNWAFPCYLACWPLAAEYYRHLRDQRLYRVLTALAFALPLGTSTFLTIHAIHPVWLIPPETDRATRQWDKMEITRQIAAELDEAGYHGPIYVPTYQWAATLRWYAIDARQLPNLARPSHFTQRENPPIDPAHLIVFQETNSPTPNPVFAGQAPYRLFRTYRLVVRGEPGPYYHLIDYSTPPAVPSVPVNRPSNR